jgi:hypothetical protein
LPPLLTITTTKSSKITRPNAPPSTHRIGNGALEPLSWMMLSEVTPLVRRALLS